MLKDMYATYLVIGDTNFTGETAFLFCFVSIEVDADVNFWE